MEKKVEWKKMTKELDALECLEGIEYVADVLKVNHKIGNRDIANQEIKEMIDRFNYRIPIIKQALIQAEQDKLNYLRLKTTMQSNIKQVLETKSKKELAFDIIVKKKVDTVRLQICKTVEQYNRLMPLLQELTEEEFELLKECL